MYKHERLILKPTLSERNLVCGQFEEAAMNPAKFAMEMELNRGTVEMK